jgi:hypothetical protein
MYEKRSLYFVSSVVSSIIFLARKSIFSDSDVRLIKVFMNEQNGGQLRRNTDALCTVIIQPLEGQRGSGFHISMK